MNNITILTALFFMLFAAETACASNPETEGNTAVSRVIRYTDMGEKNLQLAGFVKAGSFYGKRFSQKGTGSKGESWYFRGGTYKAFSADGVLREERYYMRRLYLMIYEIYVPNGVWKYYDTAGNKLREEIYVNARKKMVISYRSDGKMKSKEKMN